MPKIMGTSLEQHRTEVRTRLFEALATLLRQQPLESISIAQIAAEAEVGRTAIYNHFPDKESIVVEFATSETRRFLESLARAIDARGTATERLRTYVRYHIASRDSYHLDLGHQLRTSLSAEALLEMRTHILAAQEAVASIIRDGIASGEFAAMGEQSAVSLVNSCLQAPQVSGEEIEAFVLRAISVA
ncbi:MAG: TetR/AcrR family transcriptional regulator [Actinomycetales bacterium]|nr:TetR/AcrR family transcriptional regulator [Actinomycetales bacterium]